VRNKLLNYTVRPVNQMLFTNMEKQKMGNNVSYAFYAKDNSPLTAKRRKSRTGPCALLVEFLCIYIKENRVLFDLGALYIQDAKRI